MSAIPINSILLKQEELMAQLEKSWPKTFNKIIDEARKKGYEKFYIFSFPKKNFHVEPPTFTINHQVRLSKPLPLPSTILRHVDLKQGTSETVWTLPHEESFHLFARGKIYENEEVQRSIDYYRKHKKENEDA